MGPFQKSLLTPKGVALYGLRTTGLGPSRLCDVSLILYIIRRLSQTVPLGWIEQSWSSAVSQKSSDCLLSEVRLAIPTACVFLALVGGQNPTMIRKLSISLR